LHWIRIHIGMLLVYLLWHRLRVCEAAEARPLLSCVLIEWDARSEHVLSTENRAFPDNTGEHVAIYTQSAII
jgi:hypothetical protein